jgi:hypothetical protein
MSHMFTHQELIDELEAGPNETQRSMAVVVWILAAFAVAVVMGVICVAPMLVR